MAGLSISERIAIAGLVIMGKSFIADAYLMTHPKDMNNVKPESLYKMGSRWYNTPQAKAFRAEISSRIGATSGNNTEAMSDAEIMAELTKAARTEADQTKKSQILMRVADMKARLMADNGEIENKRVVLYIPFNSDCRQCTLYNKEKIQKGVTND